MSFKIFVFGHKKMDYRFEWVWNLKPANSGLKFLTIRVSEESITQFSIDIIALYIGNQKQWVFVSKQSKLRPWEKWQCIRNQINWLTLLCMTTKFDAHVKISDFKVHPYMVHNTFDHLDLQNYILCAGYIINDGFRLLQ